MLTEIQGKALVGPGGKEEVEKVEVGKEGVGKGR